MVNLVAVIRTSIILAPLWFALLSCGNEEGGVSSNLNTASGLDQSPSAEAGNSNLPNVPTDGPLSSLIQNYLISVAYDIDKAIVEVSNFQNQVTDFLLDPQQQKLEQLRMTWSKTHNQYIALNLHRYFYQNLSIQMEMPELARQLDRLHFRINRWPIFPGYIDYVDQYPESGLVYDISLEMTANSIREQHGRYDLSEATSGFHPLEFLLWGENTGTENDLRAFTDYIPVTSLSSLQVEDGVSLDQLSNNRRRTLFKLLVQLLGEDIVQFKKVFDATNNNATDFLRSINSTTQFELLLQPMVVLVNEEILAKSLFPMLNDDLDKALQSRFSHSSQDAMATMIASIEQLLHGVIDSKGANLESLISVSNASFQSRFYPQLDSGKACLAVLFSAVIETTDPSSAVKQQFKVVECINSFTNIADILLHAHHID